MGIRIIEIHLPPICGTGLDFEFKLLGDRVQIRLRLVSIFS